MALCASCGTPLLSGEAGICSHHHATYGDDWAVANRVMCDFFHRKKVPSRLSLRDRDNDFWAEESEPIREPIRYGSSVHIGEPIPRPVAFRAQMQARQGR